MTMCQLMTGSLSRTVCLMLTIACFIEVSHGNSTCKDYVQKIPQATFVYQQTICNDTQTTYHCDLRRSCDHVSDMAMPSWCVNFKILHDQSIYNDWAKYYNIIDCTVDGDVSLLTLQWNYTLLAENTRPDSIPVIYCACECTDHAISACSEDHHSYHFIVTPEEEAPDPCPTKSTVPTPSLTFTSSCYSVTCSGSTITTTAIHTESVTTTVVSTVSVPSPISTQTTPGTKAAHTLSYQVSLGVVIPVLIALFVVFSLVAFCYCKWKSNHTIYQSTNPKGNNVSLTAVNPMVNDIAVAAEEINGIGPHQER